MIIIITDKKGEFICMLKDNVQPKGTEFARANLEVMHVKLPICFVSFLFL